MKFLLCIFPIYFIYFLDIAKSVKLVSIKTFPIYENDEYYLQFTNKSENLPLYTIIIFQCYKNDKLEEKMVLNPGYLKGLPKPLNGDYFSVLRYTVKPLLIEVVLKFKRLADQSNLNVVYMETPSEAIRSAILDDQNIQKQFALANFRISLKLHWILNFVQKTLDHREGGLIVNSVGILVCRASEGSPYSPATITGANSLKEVSSRNVMATEHSNEAQFAFMPTIKDHLKKVVCKAGPDEITSTINIFHHPTSVHIVPAITGYVQNGSRILCQAADGYPTPKSQWIFQKGPKNAAMLYSIKADGNILDIHKNAPKGSKWVFKCQAKNNIPNSLNGEAFKTVQFTIGARQPRILLILLMVTSSILLLLMLAILLICCRSSKCSHDRKKSLVDKSLYNRTIFVKQGSDQDIMKLTNKSEHSTTTTARSSINSSQNSTLKESKGHNPVDLV